MPVSILIERDEVETQMSKLQTLVTKSHQLGADTQLRSLQVRRECGTLFPRFVDSATRQPFCKSLVVGMLQFKMSVSLRHGFTEHLPGRFSRADPPARGRERNNAWPTGAADKVSASGWSAV